MDDHHAFVADGYDRARAANEPLVRRTVEREYAAKLDGASNADRIKIHREMEREVQKRLQTLVPPDALY